MAYDVTASWQNEARKVEGIQPIDMYVVNASYSGWDPTYYANYNQNVYGYSVNASGDVTATEQLYTGFPIQRGNITNNTQGEIGGVSISIPNTDRAIESIIQDHDYLRGCDIHIVSFFAKHLPSGAAANYIGTSPDHNAGVKEKFYVDGTTSNQEAVTFSCKSKFNIRNIVVPGRKFSRECAWEYESTGECNASATVVASWTTCDKSLLACRVRSNEAHFGGFPSIPTGFGIVS